MDVDWNNESRKYHKTFEVIKNDFNRNEK